MAERDDELQTAAERALQLMRLMFTDPAQVDLMLDLVDDGDLRELVIHACAAGVVLAKLLAGEDRALAVVDALRLSSRSGEGERR